MSAPLLELLRDLKKDLFDFAFPGWCYICNRSLSSPDRHACDSCLKAILILDALFCINCRRVLGPPAHHAGCETRLRGTYSLWTYSEQVELLIHQFKYNQKIALGGKLSALLSENLARFDVITRTDLVIPVPLFSSRKRERGFNQAEIISQVIAKIHGLKMEHRGLKRHRNTRDQTKLSAAERKENVQGAFSLSNSPDLSGKIVLLVDDVTTTGATLSECARILQQADVKEVYACTLAVAV